MSIRPQIEEALLPALRRVFPGARGEDLLLMGERADVCTPLPRKYGLDIDDKTVYNILYETRLGGERLFSEAEAVDGFLNFRLSDGAVARFAEGLAGGASPERPKAARIGLNPEYVRMLLLHAADTAAEDGPLPPKDEGARRALRCCMAADSAASLQVSLRLAGEVLRRNRRELLLGRAAALAMAAALESFSERS